MKLQKGISRKSKGKSYEKWFVNIPLDIITSLDWKVGDELGTTLNNGELILKSKGRDVIATKGTSKQLTYYERFVRVYTNLPLDERNLPIVVIDGEPFNWRRCNVEITGRTKLGERIGKKLMDLEII